MDNNFSWNLCDDFIAHEGRGHNENPPGRGSGRYPWGSGAKNGKTPIHEHGEKKHKGSGHGSGNDAQYQKAVKKGEYQLDFLEKIQNVEGIDEKTRLSEYKKYLADPKNYKRPPEDLMDRINSGKEKHEESNRSETANNKAQEILNSKLDIPQNMYVKKKTLLGGEKITGEMTEEGKKFQSQVHNKTNAFYDIMDENDIDARKKAYENFQKALTNYKQQNTMESYQKMSIANQKMSSLKYSDMRTILGMPELGGGFGNFSGHGEAYIIGKHAFEDEYRKYFESNSIGHSDMTDEDAAWEELLNTPIN